MKKFMFSLIALTAFVPLFGQIDNGGFENWTYRYLFSETDGYQSTNYQAYFSTGNGNVSQVSGYTGYAPHLETITGPEGTLPGGLFIGQPGPGGLSGGLPYTGIPDSLAFWARFNIMPNDTAIVILFFSKDGLPIGQYGTTFTGSQPDFTYFSIPLGLAPVAPDSVALAIISSLPDSNSVAGSWLEVDELQLLGATQQLPNAGFDNWAEIGSDEPDDWFSSNMFDFFSGNNPHVTKTTDSFEGDYAARIESFEFRPDNDTLIFGFLLLHGFLGENGPSGGIPFPFTALNPSISGNYKYTPVETDSAFVYLNFTKFNTVTQVSDSVATFMLYLAPASVYTPFTFTVNLPEMPDSVLIGVTASNMAEQNNNIAFAGSVLYIDNLEFTEPSGLAPANLLPDVKFYPVPIQDNLNIVSNNTPIYAIEIYDMNGKQVLNQKGLYFNTLAPVNLTALPTGTYIVKLQTEQGAVTRKIEIVR